MSYTFTVRCPEPPFQALLDATGFDDLRFVEETGDDNRWSEGAWHLYRPPLSARGVELTYEGGAFSARLMALASAEDYEVAYRLLEATAGPGGEIANEEGEAFATYELRERHGDAWIAGQQQAGADVVKMLVAEKETTVTIAGPVRPFYVGPRVMGELIGEAADAALAERMIDVLREVQYLDAEGFFPASRYEVRRTPDGPAETLAIWAAGVRYLFSAVDYFALGVPDGTPVIVPHAALDDLAGAHLQWLDERQAIVEAVSEEAWPGLLVRAQEWAVTL